MAVFEADPEGFRALQLGRPAAHLVRELIQNVFDEAAGFCRVTVEHEARVGVTIVVEDDVAGGIRDEKLVFTLWASDKADSPTKRGRMGRGLKELVSVSDRTVVATEARPAIEFGRKGGEWKRRHTTQIASPAVGTRIEARIAGWKAKDAKEIVEYLRRVRPPAAIAFTVNGEQVARRPCVEEHKLDLPAVLFEIKDGERRVTNPHLDTTVELFAEEKSWVYEMGIPIEPIEYPLSVDVGQRVPLREQRDTLTTTYDRARAELAIYQEQLDGDGFFGWPLKGPQLGVLIHELAHWKALEESHGEGFFSDSDDVGGAVAQFLLEHADEALAMTRQGADPKAVS